MLSPRSTKVQSCYAVQCGVSYGSRKMGYGKTNILKNCSKSLSVLNNYFQVCDQHVTVFAVCVCVCV